ncbi:MAG: chemotaxis response regulator protein-glutamate methylesterase [Candidatus Omnitrophota bacterium]
MINEKIRVLVVDDSFLMRRILSDIINSDSDLEVVAKARDGKEALEKIFSLKPDVVTLDINLPEIDGLTVLEEVMQKQPTRVIMISAYTRAGATATIKALELGAIDFIAKPSGEISLNLSNLKDKIISKIKAVARVDLEKFISTVSGLSFKTDRTDRKERIPSSLKKLVVIGASTGGPKVILDVFQNIPPNLPAAFLIVQHMPEGFTLSFAERLSWQSGMKIKEAEDGDLVLPGKGFVAPAGYHMVVEKQENQLRIRLNQEAKVNYVRPAVDVTLTSAAEAFGKDVIGVILTGMGKDGLDGARSVKQKGGTIIVQDEQTSIIWGMPKAVFEAGLADKVESVSKISETIIKNINM